MGGGYGIAVRDCQTEDALLLLYWGANGVGGVRWGGTHDKFMVPSISRGSRLEALCEHFV